MKSKIIITALFILIFSLDNPLIAQYQLSNSTFGGGGNIATDSVQYRVYSSLGREAIGTSGNGEYTFTSGFWAGFVDPKATEVKLNVYNILGQQVARIFEKQMPAGVHVIQFDGSKYASGMYFYVIETKDFHQVKKMILVK